MNVHLNLVVTTHPQPSCSRERIWYTKTDYAITRKLMLSTQGRNSKKLGTKPVKGTSNGSHKHLCILNNWTQSAPVLGTFHLSHCEISSCSIKLSENGAIFVSWQIPVASKKNNPQLLCQHTCICDSINVEVGDVSKNGDKKVSTLMPLFFEFNTGYKTNICIIFWLAV